MSARTIELADVHALCFPVRDRACRPPFGAKAGLASSVALLVCSGVTKAADGVGSEQSEDIAQCTGADRNRLLAVR